MQQSPKHVPTHFFFLQKMKQCPSGPSSLISFSVQLSWTAGDGNDTSSMSGSLWCHNRSSLQTFKRTSSTFFSIRTPWSIGSWLWRHGYFCGGARPWLPPTVSSLIKACLITAHLYIKHQSFVYSKNSSEFNVSICRLHPDI